MLELNREKLDYYDFDFETETDCYFYVRSLIDYLATHNKNYNSEQYERIEILKDIFDSIDVV